MQEPILIKIIWIRSEPTYYISPEKYFCKMSFNKHSISYLQPWSKYKHNIFGMVESSDPK